MRISSIALCTLLSGCATTSTSLPLWSGEPVAPYEGKLTYLQELPSQGYVHHGSYIGAEESFDLGEFARKKGTDTVVVTRHFSHHEQPWVAFHLLRSQ